MNLFESNMYNINVSTANKRNAGTDANVWIELFGKKIKSGKILLKNSKNNFKKFERGQTDNFEIKCSNIGSIKSIM